MLEETFPGRVRAYYLAGSYANGSAVALSDLDLRVVFRGAFHGQLENERFLRVRQYLRQVCQVPLDCPPLDEASLFALADWLHETLTVKMASIFLYGEDIRAELPIPSFDAYLQNVLHAPRMFLARLHNTDPLPYPLTYPDPHGEFFGYDQTDPSEPARSVKRLVHAAGFIATCRLGLEAGQMVLKKSDWLPMYHRWIHDEWMPLLTQLWTLCKERWGYQVPADPAERQILRSLCHDFLAFENDYLSRPGTR